MASTALAPIVAAPNLSFEFTLTTPFRSLVSRIKPAKRLIEQCAAGSSVAPTCFWVTEADEGETTYFAAASSDGSGAGPLMVGRATPTAGTVDGVV